MENPFISASRRRSDIFFNNSSSGLDIVSWYAEQNNAKGRQLFLRSYQFRRKRSVSERIKGFAFKVKRVILCRLRSARRLRKLAWSALSFRRAKRFRFLRLVNGGDEVSCFDVGASGIRDNKSSCMW